MQAFTSMDRAHSAGHARRSGAGHAEGGAGHRQRHLHPCSGACESAQRCGGCWRRTRSPRLFGDPTRECGLRGASPGATGIHARSLGLGGGGGVLCRARYRGRAAELPGSGRRTARERPGRGVRDGAARARAAGGGTGFGVAGGDPRCVPGEPVCGEHAACRRDDALDRPGVGAGGALRKQARGVCGKGWNSGGGRAGEEQPLYRSAARASGGAGVGSGDDVSARA